MRIAFLLGKVSNIGGIPRVVSLISDGLIKKSVHEIHVISYLDENKGGYYWNKKIIFHNLISHESSMKKGIFKACLVLRKILSDEDIDILISCGSLYGPLGVLGTKFTKTKLIYWDHSNFFENTSHKFKIASKKFTARFADIVIPLTKTDKINYKNNTRAKKIVQIYNPIDQRLDNANHEYEILSKKIISVGRLTYQKNFLNVVDIGQKVFDKHPEWIWHIYGSGPQEKEIRQKIQDKKLEKNIVLMGQSDNLYELYKEYSIMVMTSIYEGFPMTLLEGLANKLPLISYDIDTGPNEIIINTENGFLVPQNDINIMAEKIMKLIENDGLRLKLSKNSLNSIKAFSMHTIISQWISLVNEISITTLSNSKK